MRRKLITLLVILILCLGILALDNSRKVFVSNEKSIKMHQLKDFKESDGIVLNSMQDNKTATNTNLQALSPKFFKDETNDSLFCGGTKQGYLIDNYDNEKIVSTTGKDPYTFEYYKEGPLGCDLVATIHDVEFTSNVVETYVKGSVYSSFSSLTDYNIIGLTRIKGKSVHPYSTASARYTSPVGYKDGVFMIENNDQLVAFDNNDKELFRQKIGKNDRTYYSLEVSKNSLFVLVKENNVLYLEGYDASQKDKIINTEYTMRQDVSKLLNNLDTELQVRKNDKYVSFTTSTDTLILTNDFANMYYLPGVNPLIYISGDRIFYKKGDIYYAGNLAKEEYEKIGNVLPIDIVAKDDTLRFKVLDENGEEYRLYYKFK